MTNKPELWLFMNGEIKEIRREEDGSFTDMEDNRNYSRKDFTALVTNQCGSLISEAGARARNYKRKFHV